MRLHPPPPPLSPDRNRVWRLRGPLLLLPLAILALGLGLLPLRAATGPGDRRAESGPDLALRRLDRHGIRGDWQRLVVSGSVSVLRDVTTESEAGGLLRGVLDSMLDPLAVMSPVYDAAGALSDLVYVAVNKAACTRLGLDEELLVGGTMRGVFPSRAADFVAAACATVLSSGNPLHLVDQQFADGRLPGTRYDIQITLVETCVAITWREVPDRGPQ